METALDNTLVFDRNNPRKVKSIKHLPDSFFEKRDFLKRAVNDLSKKELLEDLSLFSPDALRMAKRYYCVNNSDEYRNLVQTACGFDICTFAFHEAISMVLYYLDSPFDVSGPAKRKAEMLKRKVEKARNRKMFLDNVELKEEDLLSGMPKNRYASFAVVLRAWRSNWLKEECISDQERELLMYRYGLCDGEYHSSVSAAEEIEIDANKWNVYKIEKRAIDKLRVLYPDDQNEES